MQKRGTLWMALLLCTAACLPSALAEEFAEPSEDGGWTQGTERGWSLNINADYDGPFISDESIQVNGVGLTAPSIDVTGDVSTSGGGYIECAGLLQATGKVSVYGTITAGSLECSGITVTSGTLTVKTSFKLCGDEPVVTVNGTLILPSNTTQHQVEALKATGNGSIIVGTTTYSIDENGVTPVEGATIMLTDGCDVQDNGLNWNSGTCTLTLNGFQQGFTPDNTLGCGIAIQASGKAVTLVLKGDNKLTGLGGSCAGIMCAASTLTLKGNGSLDCSDSLGALSVMGGTIKLPGDCQLEDGKEIIEEGGGLT